MRIIGFVRDVKVGPPENRVQVSSTTVLSMPDDHAAAVKKMTSAACDLTAAKLHEAMFGEPYVPRSVFR